ncbi:ATP-binding protein [Clostridium sp.]|uniref:ATP-binding protein n=1 Tax=Clostridium sp. TaxID=1506 RepID=UPI002FC9D928
MISGHHLEIMNIYETIRLKEEESLKKRKEEIEIHLPEVIQLEKSIGKLCIQMSLNALRNLDNREEYLAEVKEKITTLRMKKSELLVEHGYSMDYLELKYNCPKCKDTGFIGREKCICYKKKLVQIYYANTDLSKLLSKNNFDNFTFDYYANINSGPERYSPKENIEIIVSKAWNFIKNFNESDENLLFYGNSGTGKTFLSHCIAKELLDKGHFVVYKTSEDLIKCLKDIKFNGNLELEDYLINCDLLIIDDLGTEMSSDFSKTELFNLLNSKLLKSKKMLVSTNYSLDGLLNIYSERITSRLMGNFDICKFYGKDIRLQKRMA